MTREPIFVVGVQRSGTTLLAAMLAAHSRLSCGPETHFFRRLAEADVPHLCDPVSWPRPAAEFIWSISHTGVEPGTRKALLEKYQLSKDSVPAFLAQRAPSVPAMLASVTEQYMLAKEKVRWVEKTPDHLQHLPLIRRHFPRSPIVHLVRDPRDVALSLMNVPWGVKSLLEGLLYWERLERAGRAFVSSDRLCLTVRFEDLVSAPAGELRRICGFIGEDFEPGMLDTSRTGIEINARNAPWKAKVSESVDPSRTQAWRTVLSREENRLAEAVLGDQLEGLGYPRLETFARPGRIHPGLNAAADDAGALGALAARGIRFWKAEPNERWQARIYVGHPGREWSHDQQAARGMWPVVADLARAAVLERDLYWVPGADEHKWTGYVSFFLKKCLAPYRVTAAPAAGA